MIERPADQVAEFARAGADCITIHAEADPHSHRTLAAIREAGCLAGLAINPGTPPDAASALDGAADLLLCMTVNPGWGGQAFIESSPDKIARLAELSPAGRLLEVDGGIDATSVAAVADAGASLFVAGSAIFGADDPAEAYRADRRRRRRGLDCWRPRRGRCEDARDLLPPRPVLAGDVRACRSARRPAAQAACARRREQLAVSRPRSGRRRAAAASPVPSRRTRRRATTPIPSTVSGCAGSPSSSRHRRTVNTCGAPRRGQRRHRRLAERPGAPAVGQRLHLVELLEPDEDVKLVAGLDLGRAARRDRGVAADDQVDQRLARQAEVLDRRADRGVVRGAPSRPATRCRAGG